MDQKKKKLSEMMTEIREQMNTGDPDKIRSGLLMLRAGLSYLIFQIDEYLQREDEHGKKEH